jgi:hypothetical protein
MGALYFYEPTSPSADTWRESAVATISDSATEKRGGGEGESDMSLYRLGAKNGFHTFYSEIYYVSNVKIYGSVALGPVDKKQLYSKTNEISTAIFQQTFEQIPNEDQEGIPNGNGKGKEVWSYTQHLEVSAGQSFVDLYDGTIVISAIYADTSKKTNTKVGAVSVFYPNTEQFGLKPKGGPQGKPVPTQWSVQQVYMHVCMCMH